ncbi:MAG TPA: cell surface protein SprA, partial [Paludibacteraceae bacterium]|nr:cell surface protein SprA [Paludibacteraceae bacterium]
NIRNIQLINEIMESQYRVYGIVGGEDYEKIESARRLEPSEYTLNSQLGFISLKTPLYADEVLAVAYEYTLGGKVYQVGEFSTDGVDAPNSLIVKLLKGTAVSPHLALWDLMMKNVYYLGGMQLQKDKFKLDVQYKNDSTGVYVNYLTEGKVKNKILLKVMNLDRLDSRNEPNPDGKFDYVEGFTVNSSTGRIYFPVVEPFGEHLRKAIGNDAIADKYVFQELYDSTLVIARELSEKNKFRLAGEYQASSGSEIRLNAMNVPRGSVKVTAGGRQLVENVDYTVDYTMGTVTILNQSVLAAGTPIDVSLENQSTFNLQRKTLLGTHLEYQFNKNFSVGGTIMHLSEMPLVTKTEMGSEPIANTIWGLNASYRGESQWLTNVIDKIPGINATAPSTIVFNGEFAHLIPGHRKIKHNSGYAYLDDFESTKTGIDLRYPYYWHLASTPYDPAPDALFSEAAKSNDVNYGKNRALMSWYSIDNSVFNRNNSTTPEHIRRDKDLQSNHLTREVLEQEIFPNREGIAGQS